MARLWIEEPTPARVWHLATKRLGDDWYRAACHWEVRVIDASRLWPQKSGEPGPAPEDRCRQCDRDGA